MRSKTTGASKVGADLVDEALDGLRGRLPALGEGLARDGSPPAHEVVEVQQPPEVGPVVEGHWLVEVGRRLQFPFHRAFGGIRTWRVREVSGKVQMHQSKFGVTRRAGNVGATPGQAMSGKAPMRVDGTLLVPIDGSGGWFSTGGARKGILASGCGAQG